MLNVEFSPTLIPLPLRPVWSPARKCPRANAGCASIPAASSRAAAPARKSAGRKSQPSRGVKAQRWKSPSAGETSNCSTSAICDQQWFSSATGAAISAMTWPRLAMSICKFSGVSDARIRPPSMIIIRLQVISASGRMCVEISTVCEPARLLMSCRTARIWCGSSPMVGSSRMIKSGSCTSASASPTRCRYPLESWPMMRLLTSVRLHCCHYGVHALARSCAQLIPLRRARNLQVFAHAHFVVQRIVLRHVTDAPPDFLGIMKYVQPGHPRRARGGRQEARQNPHGGAFAGAVRPEQADDLAASDRERKCPPAPCDRRSVWSG